MYGEMVESVSEQHGQRIYGCYLKKTDDMCETYAKPEADMSVAEISPVCTVAQSEARSTGFANLLPITGLSELTSQASVPVDTCTLYSTVCVYSAKPG